METLFALDVETAPTVATKSPYALEPYRFKQGLARVTCITVANENTSVTLHERANNMGKLRQLLAGLAGKTVIAQNAVFDVAWLIEQTDYELVSQINWVDTMLLGKWVHNQQSMMSYSLINQIERELQDHPDYEEFDKIKHETYSAGENYEYWLRRNVLDARLTLALYKQLLKLLPDSCVVGYTMEQGNILPLARGWMSGIKLNKKAADELLPKIEKAKTGISAALGETQACLGSPTQLRHLLFEKWGLTGLTKTKTGWSTNKDDLAKLNLMHRGTEVGKKLQLVMDFRQVKTLQSKYIDGINRVCAYNKGDINHSAPRIFSTYTGRYTYSSGYTKMKGVGKECQTGIATHQLPRKGPTRALLSAHDDHDTGELDAAAQEMRGMAVEAHERNMIMMFNHGKDLHGDMAATIAHEEYEDFMGRYKAGNAAAENFRYAGKLLNLSCQYRIGDKSLMGKFFSTYQIIISRMESKNYLKLYLKQYPDIEPYWKEAIAKAKRNGYAESIGGRRYYIDQWNGSKRYGSEQSAINFPIQGMGGDHKNVAVTEISKHFSEPILMLDLHDGLWYSLPKGGGGDESKELLLEMQHHLNHNVNYEEIWNKDIPIPLPFDAKLGTNFGNMRDI